MLLAAAFLLEEAVSCCCVELLLLGFFLRRFLTRSVCWRFWSMFFCSSSFFACSRCLLAALAFDETGLIKVRELRVLMRKSRCLLAWLSWLWCCYVAFF